MKDRATVGLILSKYGKMSLSCLRLFQVEKLLSLMHLLRAAAVTKAFLCTMKAATSLSSALTLSLRMTPRSYKRMAIPTA